MDVQVKILLQGGHSWEFCCDEDDPIVFGLVSSLPGANLEGHAAPDGLVQIQTPTNRLYITRSSLVAVEVSPIIDVSRIGASQRFVIPSVGFLGGMAGPSPFVLANSAVSKDLHSALLEHAIGQHASASSSQAGVKAELGELKAPISNAFKVHFEKSRAAFDLPADDTFDLDCELFALGDTQALSIEGRREHVLSFVYHFFRQPKAFERGGVRLFDGQTQDGMSRASGTFRDLEPTDNVLLIFPSSVVSAGLPVHCKSSAMEDRLFAIRGAFTRIKEA